MFQKIFEIFTGLKSKTPTPGFGNNAQFSTIQNAPGALQRLLTGARGLASAVAVPALLVATGFAMYHGAKWYSAYSGMNSAQEQSWLTSGERVQARIQDSVKTRENQELSNRAFGGYYPVVATLPNGKKIYSVRSGLNAIPSSSLRHGGISDELVSVEAIGRMCNTAAEATEILAEKIDAGTLRSPPLAGGYVASIGGKSYTIDDWGAVDFGVLRQRGK